MLLRRSNPILTHCSRTALLLWRQGCVARKLWGQSLSGKHFSSYGGDRVGGIKTLTSLAVPNLVRISRNVCLQIVTA
ncbi:hypothetical protein B0T21DRAFT_210045 [Apiosordaria backusii]|uniref:Uncharacterized protein n=1 Tax=Apiosordaria backusii TaxID=314023 RepID=A0AA40B7X1_9PEZI|nr:hypothetical protein B0T21DRAFT_210045 [Apiosordaria backusii]